MIEFELFVKDQGDRFAVFIKLRDKKKPKIGHLRAVYISKNFVESN